VRFAARRRARFFRGGEPVSALEGVSLTLGTGEAYGLVGESGSGKTTLARCVAGLARPSAGRILVEGRPVETGSLASRRALWRRVQYVHQNPRSALNPRRRVGQILAGPLESLLGVSRAECGSRVRVALESVGLEPDAARRRPHAFSGGQAQRIAIARALVVEPALLVLDEPTSALDVRVQAELLALLRSIRERTGVSLLFISHDLPVVAAVADRVGVLRAGRIVEEGDRMQVLREPRSEYTRALIASVPDPPG
jgi:peptide/nickel transport system ATP-binding protein